MKENLANTDMLITCGAICVELNHIYEMLKIRKLKYESELVNQALKSLEQKINGDEKMKSANIRVNIEIKKKLDEIKQALFDSDSWTESRLPTYSDILEVMLEKLKDD